MQSRAMDPYGAALQAYMEGDRQAELVLRRDDGFEGRIPVSVFFRSPEEFSDIDTTAVESCRGSVLDVGAGSGVHSLVLQEKGCPVTAIDLSSQAVDVLSQRGVRDVFRCDIFNYSGGPRDTVLLLGHGIGMVETLAGLDRLLELATQLITPGGQILLDSLDVRVTDDPRNLAYHEANRQAGRYIGEIRLRSEFRGQAGPWFGWLQVDPATLEEYARSSGWACEILVTQPVGDYLARLTRPV